MKINTTATIEDSDGTQQTVTLLNCEYEKEMFETGEFSLTVQNDQGGGSQPNYDLLVGADGTQGQARKVLISRNTVKKFNGVIDKIRVRDTTIEISGRGNAIKLSWRSCTEWQEFTATALDSAIDTLLTNNEISQHATDKVTTAISVAFQEGVNHFVAIYGTIKNYVGVECEVDTDDKLRVKTTIGTDKSADVTLAFGTNIMGLEREIDSFLLKNSVKLRGSGEGIFQLTSGPSTDATSITRYKQRDAIIPARNAYFQDELDNRKTNKLDEMKDPVDTVKDIIFLDDSGEDLNIGDTVTVTNARMGLSGTYRIMRLRYSWSGAGEIVTATLANTSKSMEKEIGNMSYRLDVERFYPQGSPLWIPLNSPLYALDVDQNYVYKFKVPDDTDWNVTIKDFKITLFLEAYRTWQKTALSTTHAHTTTDSNNHTHETTAFDEELPTEGYDNTVENYTVPSSYTDLTGMAWDPVLNTGLYVIKVTLGNKSGADWGAYARVVSGGTVVIGAEQFGEIQDGNSITFIWHHYINSGDDYSDIAVQVYNDSGGTRGGTFHVNVTYLGRWRTPNTGAHSHTIGIGGAHVHGVVEGITLGTNYPVDVELWVNGTKVADKATHADLAGGSSKTIEDIDLSAEITIGVNTMTIKSTGASSKGMVGHSGGGRVFVQSRT